jgi:hypothetical protein
VFERFAIDPRNTLLAQGRERTDAPGAELLAWLEQDDWINAPLDRSLPASGDRAG